MKAILFAAGVLLDMGKTVTISTVRVLFESLPGTDFQVRIGARRVKYRGLLDRVLAPGGHFGLTSAVESPSS